LRGPNKGDFIVKLQSIIQYALTLAATFLLAACGGGGASVNPNQTGTALVLSPVEATFYGGVPATMTIQGGRPPFTLTSSEPNVISVPATINSNTFDVLPTNPSVIDAGLPPGSLPIRTINLTVHDTLGNTATAKIHVGQNFLTGYGITFGPSTCPVPTNSTATSITPCAGSDTTVSFTATSNGILHGNEQFRLDVVRGQFAFFDPISSTNTVTQSLLVNSDHDGKVTAIIRVAAGVPSQIAVLRITEVASGVTTDEIFTIVGNASATTLTAIPSSITFTGALSTQCGTGSADVFIFDGTPPYSALSSNPNVSVAPVSPNAQPGRFTITANNPNVCLSSVPVIFLDSSPSPARTTVTVTTSAGSTVVPPPTPLAVAPNAITLVCGGTGSVAVVGGSGTYSATTSSPVITATVSGHTVSITRIAPDPPGGPFPTTSTVSITDGASVVVVTVTAPASC
jgi:hypothetical protein